MNRGGRRASVGMLKREKMYRFFCKFVSSFRRQKHKLVINLFFDINYGLRAAYCIYGYVTEKPEGKNWEIKSPLLIYTRRKVLYLNNKRLMGAFHAR